MSNRKILDDLFSAYKSTYEYKDGLRMEIMLRKSEFEKNLDEMWAICNRGCLQQVPEYKKGVRQIKSAGLEVLRNKSGKHKIVVKNEGR